MIAHDGSIMLLASEGCESAEATAGPPEESSIAQIPKTTVPLYQSK